MDNITHSLAGALVGEAAHDLTKNKENISRHPLLLAASVLANNFPDLDAIYTGIMPPPLGSLLHHRGHTHTLLLVIPQILMVLAILLLIPKFRAQLKDRKTLKLVTLVTLIGFLLHFVFDSWNSYGIHPFYPFSGDWIYGDLIFIIEPFLWVAFSIPLFFSWKNKIVRSALFLLVSAVPVVAASKQLLTWHSVGGLAIFAAVLYFFSKRATSISRQVVVGAAAAAIFLMVEGVASHNVRSQLHENFEKESDSHRIIDLVLSPLPANPFCWTVIQLEIDPVFDKYISKKGVMPSWPSVVSAEACTSLRVPGRRTEKKISEFISSVKRDCYLDAWMRFARAPHIEDSLAFDLRYSQGAIDNFTKINVSLEERACPRFIPPWGRPRQDLLDAQNAQL